MHTYPTNSPHAAGRIIAVAAVDQGGLQREVLQPSTTSAVKAGHV